MNNNCCCKCCCGCHNRQAKSCRRVEVIIELYSGCSIGGGHYKYHVNGLPKIVPCMTVRQEYTDQNAVSIMQRLGEELNYNEIRSVIVREIFDKF